MLTAAEIDRLAREAASAMVGARIQKIGGPGPERVVIEAFGESGKARLLVALEPVLPRLHLSKLPHPGPKQPFPMVEVLRKELMGGRIRGLAAIPGERIVRLEVAVHRRERADERILHMELFRQSRNLILTDGSLKILATLRRGGPARPDIKRGATWSAPPKGPGKDDEAAPFAFLEEAAPTDLSEAVETWAAPREEASREQRLATRLLSGLRRRRKKERRLVTNLEAELEQASRSEELSRWAELIKHNLGDLKRGAAEATVTDWSSGEAVTVTVPLDPKAPPLDTMNRYFKQARKLEKSLPKVAARLGNAEERVTDLEAMIARAEDAEDLETLTATQEEAVAKGWAKAEPIPDGARPAPRRKAVQEKRKPYRRFVSKDGIEILVGRTAADNDELSLRIGRGNEHWMHVAGRAGSHVVIRHTGDEVPSETLLDAAVLAVHFSQARGGGAEVHRTRCKHVSKFRGANPGQVQLARFKSLRVRPDPERLDRLVNSPNPS